MRLASYLAVLAVALVATGARAETEETFHPAITYDASHVVLVETVSAKEAKVRVVESWKGDFAADQVFTVPGLEKLAEGRMVLFLRQPPQGGAWQGAGSELRLSMVWVKGKTVSGVQQLKNPGPAEVGDLSLDADGLKKAVERYVRTETALVKAKAEQDVGKKVAVLAEVINGDFDKKDEAFAELGDRGDKAVPVLRKFVQGPPNFQQPSAVAALARAGGKDVVPELTKMLNQELDYWKKTGPTLEKGWWQSGQGEPWMRYNKLGALVQVYAAHHDADLRKAVEATRDLFRKLPAFEEDKGISRVADECDRVLDGKGN
jgi:hypothetical protein